MTLRLVARLLGIVGGVIASINGFLILREFYPMRFLLQWANPLAIEIVLFSVIGIPVIGIMGAALIKNKPLWGSSMMAVVGILLLSSSFRNEVSPLYLVASGLFLVGAVLGIVSAF